MSWGWNNLTACGELDETSRHHANFFLAFAEQREPGSLLRLPIARLDRFAADHDNLGAACDRLCDGSTVEECLRLAAACAPYWYARGHLREGSTRLHNALATAGAPPSAARGARPELGRHLRDYHGGMSRHRPHSARRLWRSGTPSVIPADARRRCTTLPRSKSITGTGTRQPIFSIKQRKSGATWVSWTISVER